MPQDYSWIPKSIGNLQGFLGLDPETDAKARAMNADIALKQGELNLIDPKRTLIGSQTKHFDALTGKTTAETAGITDQNDAVQKLSEAISANSIYHPDGSVTISPQAAGTINALTARVVGRGAGAINLPKAFGGWSLNAAPQSQAANIQSGYPANVAAATSPNRALTPQGLADVATRQQTEKLAQIGAQGQNQLAVEGARGQNRLAVESMKNGALVMKPPSAQVMDTLSKAAALDLKRMYPDMPDEAAMQFAGRVAQYAHFNNTNTWDAAQKVLAEAGVAPGEVKHWWRPNEQNVPMLGGKRISELNRYDVGGALQNLPPLGQRAQQGMAPQVPTAGAPMIGGQPAPAYNGPMARLPQQQPAMDTAPWGGQPAAPQAPVPARPAQAPSAAQLAPIVAKTQADIDNAPPGSIIEVNGKRYRKPLPASR